MTYQDIQSVNAKIDLIDIKGAKYAKVSSRLKAFRELYPEGYIKTKIVSLEGDMVVIQAEVGYFEEGFEHILATGTAYEMRGSTNVNKTSFIENCETSAVGRALGMAGYGDTEIASYDEVNGALIAQDEIHREEVRSATIDPFKANALTNRCLNDGISIEKLCKIYKVAEIADLNEKQHEDINRRWNKEIKTHCSLGGES